MTRGSRTRRPLNTFHAVLVVATSLIPSAAWSQSAPALPRVRSENASIAAADRCRVGRVRDLSRPCRGHRRHERHRLRGIRAVRTWRAGLPHAQYPCRRTESHPSHRGQPAARPHGADGGHRPRAPPRAGGAARARYYDHAGTCSFISLGSVDELNGAIRDEGRCRSRNADRARVAGRRRPAQARQGSRDQPNRPRP